MFFVSFSLTLKNPNRATRGKALESTENATIANGERLSNYIEVRDDSSYDSMSKLKIEHQTLIKGLKYQTTCANNF